MRAFCLRINPALPPSLRSIYLPPSPSSDAQPSLSAALCTSSGAFASVVPVERLLLQQKKRSLTHRIRATGRAQPACQQVVASRCFAMPPAEDLLRPRTTLEILIV